MGCTQGGASKAGEEVVAKSPASQSSQASSAERKGEEAAPPETAPVIPEAPAPPEPPASADPWEAKKAEEKSPQSPLTEEKTASEVPAQEYNDDKASLEPMEALFQEVRGLANDEQLKRMDPFASPKQPRRPSTLSMPYPDYVKAHEQVFTNLLQLDAKPGWVYKKRELDVDISTIMDEESGLLSFKGVADMNVANTDTEGFLLLLSEFSHAPFRPEFDEVCIYGETLEQFLPYYRAAYFQFKSPVGGVISMRDACLITRFRREADGTVLVSVVSEPHAAKPEVPEFVRLELCAGGYIIRPTKKPGTFNVTFTGTVDPKGWLPAFVKNAAAWKQPLVMGKYMKKLGR